MKSPLSLSLVRRAALAFTALLVLTAPAGAQDPLTPSQTWLPRVVPANLTPPPPEKTGAIAVIGYADMDHPDLAGDWAIIRRGWPALGDDASEAELEARARALVDGTATAAIIGAPRDGVGVEGVLPGAQVWIYGSNGTCRDFATAIRRAVRDGAWVITAAYGFSEGCIQLRRATSFAFGKGVLVVGPAGIKGRPRLVHPAQDPHVLTVGSIGDGDRRASFSQTGIHTDLVAPGVDVFTAAPLWWDVVDGTQDGYILLDGTGVSTAMVGAAAAWVRARRPKLTVDRVADVLRRSARDVGPKGWDRSTGWGVVDIARALRVGASFGEAEPNDEIGWLKGKRGFPVVKPFVPQKRTRVTRGRLAVAKDPVDIYPLRIGAGKAAQIIATPRKIAIDLNVWRPGAQEAVGKGVVARSRRPKLKSERVVVRNTSKRARTYWIEVRARPGLALHGDYRLLFRQAA